MKDIQGLYTEIYKTLQREIKQNLTKGRAILVFWVVRLSIAKGLILPK